GFCLRGLDFLNQIFSLGSTRKNPAFFQFACRNDFFTSFERYRCRNSKHSRISEYYSYFIDIILGMSELISPLRKAKSFVDSNETTAQKTFWRYIEHVYFSQLTTGKNDGYFFSI